MQFNTHQEASAAIAQLHDTLLDGAGRGLIVKLAEDSRGTQRRVRACVYICMWTVGARSAGCVCAWVCVLVGVYIHLG